jgi:hypothetical protein
MGSCMLTYGTVYVLKVSLVQPVYMMDACDVAFS